MPMPKGWLCLPTPTEHAIIPLLKKRKRKNRKDKTWLKAILLFRREILFPECTVQTKLTASLLKLCLEQSSKMINKASISHKGMTLESASRQIDRWQAEGSEDTPGNRSA